MSDIKVSLVYLTYKRAKMATEIFKANRDSAGYPLHEVIHVDNGDGPYIQADTTIIHKVNQGVAKGYNRGMLLATGTHIVITGCDRLMPNTWLAAFVSAAKSIQNTGVISCYSAPSAAWFKDQFLSRYTGKCYVNNGVSIQPAIACEARFHSREFLLRAGFFREDFGLYGFEDVEWCERAERVAKQYGLLNYTLYDLPLAVHTREDEFLMGDGSLEAGYQEFKDQENAAPYKQALAKRCWEIGNPYYNPYSRFEPVIFEVQK